MAVMSLENAVDAVLMKHYKALRVMKYRVESSNSCLVLHKRCEWCAPFLATKSCSVGPVPMRHVRAFLRPVRLFRLSALAAAPVRLRLPSPWYPCPPSTRAR